MQARARFRPFRSKVNPSGTARPAHASALDSGGAARSDAGCGGESEIFLHDFNHCLQRPGGNSEASPAAQSLIWPAPMTRARTAGCGALTPPPRDRGSDTVLMSFLSLMQSARTTLGMWRRQGQRDWRTQSKISAPPLATPGSHLQESRPTHGVALGHVARISVGAQRGPANDPHLTRARCAYRARGSSPVHPVRVEGRGRTTQPTPEQQRTPPTSTPPHRGRDRGRAPSPSRAKPASISEDARPRPLPLLH